MHIELVDIEGARRIRHGVAVIIDVMRAYTVAAWALHRLHNSPHQLLSLDVQDRTILQRTTAGTRAAVAAQSVDRIYCASFVCVTATAQSVTRHSPDLVSLVISGGLEADEDLACAELIAEILRESRPDATRYIHRALDSAAAKDLSIGVERGYAGVSPEDPQMCVELDRFNFAMEARKSSGHLSLQKTGEMEP